MIDFLRRRRYRKAVYAAVEENLVAIHGPELGGECVGFFATALINGLERGDIQEDLIDRFLSNGLSVEHGALALFDTSISLLKHFTRNLESDPDISRIVTLMDKSVDTMFLKNPGMVVPRNGTAGPGMEAFTKDWNPN